MTFERLNRGDAIAWVAALALLVFTAMDWWSTQQGDEYRALQKEATGQTGIVAQGQADQTREDARIAAQSQEKNAWQAGHLIDKLTLAVLIAAALAATLAAAARASDRRFEPPWTPSALAAALALLGTLLIAYRLANEPGFDSVTTVKAGVLLALIASAAVAVGSGIALQREVDGRAYGDGLDSDGNGSRPSPAGGHEPPGGPDGDGDGRGPAPEPQAGAAG